MGLRGRGVHLHAHAGGRTARQSVTSHFIILSDYFTSPCPGLQLLFLFLLKSLFSLLITTVCTLLSFSFPRPQPHRWAVFLGKRLLLISSFSCAATSCPATTHYCEEPHCSPPSLPISAGDAAGCPQSHRSSQLHQPRSSSLSSQRKGSSPDIDSLPLPPTSLLVFLLCWGPKMEAVPRQDLTSTKQRGQSLPSPGSPATSCSHYHNRHCWPSLLPGHTGAESLAVAELGGICSSPLIPTILSQEAVRWVMHHLPLVNPCQLLPLTVVSLLCPDMGSRRSHSLILPGTDAQLAGLQFLRLGFGLF